jgi:hypothetical protein
MANLTFSFGLGSNFSSTPLIGTIIDTSNNTIGTIASSYFIYVGGGYFMMTYSFSNNFTGGVIVATASDPTNILTFASVNLSDQTVNSPANVIVNNCNNSTSGTSVSAGVK